MRESVDEFTWIGVTISGRTINNLWYADDIVLIQYRARAVLDFGSGRNLALFPNPALAKIPPEPDRVLLYLQSRFYPDIR